MTMPIATQLTATDPSRCLPDYENGNFAHIPGLLSALLGVPAATPLTPERFGFRQGQFEKVVFLFLDAFGWNQFSYFLKRRHPMAVKWRDRGQTHKITAQFPSTTAAHVTTFSTGQMVAQHGVFEWQYYEPEVDAVIYPLLFSFAGQKKRDTLRDAYVDPRDILPTHTLAQDLEAAGVAVRSFVPREYTTTAYNQVMARGARVTGYRTVAGALVALRRAIERTQGPTLFHFYTPHIDSNAHDYGPFDYRTLAEADATLILLDRLLFQPLRGREDVLFVISADHGQVRVEPEETFYINLQPEFQELRCYLRANHRGAILPPGGSPRDLFLYVLEEYVGRAQTLLRKMLGGRADVFRIEQLIEAGLFGTTSPSDDFMKRVGNLVILPRGQGTVWWYEKKKFEMTLHGLHGGLSRDEMEIPLIFYRP
jgi:hypothetical protein